MLAVRSLWNSQASHHVDILAAVLLAPHILGASEPNTLETLSNYEGIAVLDGLSSGDKQTGLMLTLQAVRGILALHANIVVLLNFIALIRQSRTVSTPTPSAMRGSNARRVRWVDELTQSGSSSSPSVSSSWGTATPYLCPIPLPPSPTQPINNISSQISSQAMANAELSSNDNGNTDVNSEAPETPTHTLQPHGLKMNPLLDHPGALDPPFRWDMRLDARKMDNAPSKEALAQSVGVLLAVDESILGDLQRVILRFVKESSILLSVDVNPRPDSFWEPSHAAGLPYVTVGDVLFRMYRACREFIDGDSYNQYAATHVSTSPIDEAYRARMEMEGEGAKEGIRYIDILLNGKMFSGLRLRELPLGDTRCAIFDVVLSR
ncbi:hypothetical protein A0H81_14397 [Grifola frondosa]|uniref:DUF6699 domain-containing protein n=1 Tax=Grifola frondosa TaxID=5627 RepID=A0A1C7LLL0_GRIFR|nr:hypothetical protein A0H81_14397 [Grifola frondosa]